MRGRPNLFVDYKKESAILSNNTQKFWFTLMIIFSLGLVFVASDYWILLLTTAFLIAVAAWGLNIVSGFAGQISLAHGVFVGIGTYTSAVLGGVATSYALTLDHVSQRFQRALVSASHGLAAATVVEQRIH